MASTARHEGFEAECGGATAPTVRRCCLLSWDPFRTTIGAEWVAEDRVPLFEDRYGRSNVTAAVTYIARPE